MISTLALMVLVGLAGCGGKAHTSDLGRAGGGGTASVATQGGGGDSAAPTAPAPSVVRLADGGESEGEDPTATAECLQGFQGFRAELAEQVVDFKAFVFAPGDYTGDPLYILYLDVQREDGQHYQAAAGTADGTGSINLHVEAVDPRFIGSIEAVLTNVDDPSAPELPLKLTFDIAVRAGCN